jgi:hypothetical protein
LIKFVFTSETGAFIEHVGFVNEGKGTGGGSSSRRARKVLEKEILNGMGKELHPARDADGKLEGPETGSKVGKVMVRFECAENTAKVSANTNGAKLGVIKNILVEGNKVAGTEMRDHIVRNEGTVKNVKEGAE